MTVAQLIERLMEFDLEECEPAVELERVFGKDGNLRLREPNRVVVY